MIKKLSYFTLLAAISVLWSADIRAQTAPGEASELLGRRTDLEERIRSKSEELENLNRQMEAVRQNLESTKSERMSLQSELKRLQTNVSQLQLSIRTDEATNQKLGLEIDSLHYDISDITDSIATKEVAVNAILRQIQQNDDRNLLYTLLTNDSLADGIMKVQSLQNLREQLGVDIVNLVGLREQLGAKVASVTQKKTEIEIRRRAAEVKKSLIEEQKEDRQVILVQTKSKESLYEQQLAELKKQQDDIAEEIDRYEQQLRSEFNVGLLPGRRAIFAWPMAVRPNGDSKTRCLDERSGSVGTTGGVGTITQCFGEISNLYRGKPHNGLDIGVPAATPVLAAESGTVIAVGNNDRSAWSKYQYGKYIMVRHENNLTTLYAHLSRFAVAKGDAVERGQIIGYSGNTGYSTGPHLHFGVYWAPSVEFRSVPPAAGLVPVGVTVAPEDYL